LSEDLSRRRRLRGLVAITLEALLFSDIVVLFNFILISFFLSDTQGVMYLVSLVTLIEGGLGLTLGGLAVIGAGPGVSKIGEKVFNRAPYTPERAKHAEGVARVFIFFSVILLAIGFLLGG
jgi:hypothetical protein